MIITADYILQFNTLEFSKKLLGMSLVTQINGQKCGGKIVEVEAYLPDDAAAHSHRGQTIRNKSVFQKAGTVYVYFIYGNYYCVNIVTEKEGFGSAILIRAIEPFENSITVMSQRRKTDNIYNLCSGPGKLCIAMGIDKTFDGLTLPDDKIFLESGEELKDSEIVVTKRVGISKAQDLDYRFYVKDSDFVSRK
jgi:DNA-3-methyladenine glycosylase